LFWSLLRALVAACNVHQRRLGQARAKRKARRDDNDMGELDMELGPAMLNRCARAWHARFESVRDLVVGLTRALDRNRVFSVLALLTFLAQAATVSSALA